MAAHDERTRLDAEAIKGRLTRAAGALGGDDGPPEGRIEHTVDVARSGIDRVAEKVKGLLRSDP